MAEIDKVEIDKVAEVDQVRVTIRITEAGNKFDYNTKIPSDLEFEAFKAAVEGKFDQRLQFSFAHRGPLPRQVRVDASGTPSPVIRERGAAVPVSPGDDESNADVDKILDRAVDPLPVVTHVALNEMTWPLFLSKQNPVVRAWSVFPGIPLSNVQPPKEERPTREARLEKFAAGTENLPSAKRFQELRRRLEKLETPPPIKNAGRRQLDLSRKVTEEEREGAVKRLWYDVEQRQGKVSEREKEEDERVRAKLKIRVRKGRPADRSEAEEAFIARQQEILDRRYQKLQDLDADQEERVARVTRAGGTVLGPDEVEATVARLARPRGDTPETAMRREEKFFGKPVAGRTLSKGALDTRLESLYTSALQKKSDKLRMLEETHPPPQAPVSKLRAKQTAELIARLAQR
eukprot:Hpha_TRINITY_DN12238_c0_g1::TRINITY_DN12238_c0_g1_i1::g.16967::m.16967